MRVLLTAWLVLVMFFNATAYADLGVERMVSSTATRFNVPPKLALRVARVESDNKCNLVGTHGERGPLQINPRSAASLGYKNIAHASCQRQLDAGMAHLQMCYKLAHGDWGRTAACHNGGPGVLSHRKIRHSIRQYVSMVLR